MCNIQNHILSGYDSAHWKDRQRRMATINETNETRHWSLTVIQTAMKKGAIYYGTVYPNFKTDT